MTSWSDLPVTERERLHKNEVSNRSRSRAEGLPTVPVSVEGLWLIQRGMCPCDVCRCTVPLEIGDTVIAHRKHLKGQGSPGHVPHNVQLWRKECNDREARQERSDGAKYDRFKVEPVTTEQKRERKAEKKQKIQSRGFDKRFKKKLNGKVVAR